MDKLEEFCEKAFVLLDTVAKSRDSREFGKQLAALYIAHGFHTLANPNIPWRISHLFLERMGATAFEHMCDFARAVWTAKREHDTGC